MARPSYIRFRDGKPAGPRGKAGGIMAQRGGRLSALARWATGLSAAAFVVCLIACGGGLTPGQRAAEEKRRASLTPEQLATEDKTKPVPYETIRGWTAGQVFGRVIVINGRDATQERLKALGDQLRTGARGYRVVNVDVYDDLEAAHNRDSMAGKANSNDVSDDECRALLSYDVAHRVANYTRGNNVDELTIHLNGTTATVDYSTPEEKATRDAWRRDHPPPLLLEPRVPSAPSPQPTVTPNEEGRERELKAKEREAAEKEHQAAIEAAKWRTWTDSTGQHKIEARFKKMAFGKVTLVKSNGQEVTIPIEKLSDEGQKWIRKRR